MKSKQDKKNNMRASMQKPIIDAEIDQPALDILAKQKDKKRVKNNIIKHYENNFKN